MSLSKQIGPEFEAYDFTHDQRTYEVFRGGSGPAVLVLHEIPGLHPGVIDFARRLISAGYTVYLPSLFGRPVAPATGPPPQRANRQRLSLGRRPKSPKPKRAVPLS